VPDRADGGIKIAVYAEMGWYVGGVRLDAMDGILSIGIYCLEDGSNIPPHLGVNSSAAQSGK
jgi:hypothetical protein